MGYLEDEIDRHAKEEEDDLERKAKPTSREIETQGQMFMEGGGRRMADDREVDLELRRMESQSDEPDSLRILYLRAKEHLEREGQRMLERLNAA